MQNSPKSRKVNKNFIVWDDLLSVTQHGEDFSKFGHCIESISLWDLFRFTVCYVGIDPI